MDPRAEIDTTPPFESVKEAVDHFGGGGTPWIPLHLLRLAAAAHHDNESMEYMEEQALQVERDLMTKEHQTRNVLKELESAKRLVESLKSNLRPELASFMSSPDRNVNSTTHLHGSVSPRLMYTELNQAKLSLTRTSSGLASIQSSLESLNMKLRQDKVVLEKMHVHNLDKQIETDDIINLYNELKEVNFEAEQFKKMTEASRNEVIKAMAEIERTKHSIRMAEMRLDAAKKMEEAAKAIEAIAIAERNQLFDDGEDRFDGYRGRRSMERTNFVASNNNYAAKFKFRNSYAGHRNNPEDQSLTSLGDVLRRKLVVQDDGMLGRRDDEEERVSLSQMLRGGKGRRVVARPEKATTTTTKVDVNVVVEEKRYFFHRKKFGFIQIPVYTRRRKQ